MPITQERFISIVNASAEVLDKIRYIYKLTDPTSTQAILDANSLLSQIPADSQLATALRGCVDYLAAIRRQIIESNALSSDAAIAIQVERAYFQRTAKQNARAAEAQRRARVRKGATPRLVQQGLSHAGISTDPNPPTRAQELRIEREMIPRNMEDDPIFNKYHKDLLASWTKDKTNGQ